MGMTGDGASAAGVTSGGAGALGGKDSSGNAEGNMIGWDGSGLVQGVAKKGKAAEDDEGSENFRGRL